MRKSGGKLIRLVLPLIIQALNVSTFLGLLQPLRILAATMVAFFVLLFLLDSRQDERAPSLSR